MELGRIKSEEAIFEQRWDSRVLNPAGQLSCGKTVVFVAKVTEECVRKGDRVLILAHRGELLDQAADKLMKTTRLGCTCLGKGRKLLPGQLVPE